VRSKHDELFTFCLQDIDNLSKNLGILWEFLKDQPFNSSTLYISFLWNIELRTVTLSPSKFNKYLLTIHEGRKHQTHTLHDVQRLYGKILHACLAVPWGHAYLTGLESILALCGNKPFLPHRPKKGIAEDLNWWSLLLQSGGATRAILPPTTLKDHHAFSDASSGIRIGIVIGRLWRAWRLIPGWKTLNGK
jgi:hypothetical protein